MSRSLWIAWRVALAVAYVELAWIAGLVLIVWWTVDAVLVFVRERQALAPFTRCPRGHGVAQYGLFRCAACGGAAESSCWTCPVCHAESGYTDCPTCGLAVRNPRYG